MAVNSLAYLVYSALALAANKPAINPSAEDWPISVSDSWNQEPYNNAKEQSWQYPVTDSWNQGPVDSKYQYKEERCPYGKEWSDCDANCEQTCENVGKPVICPRMCLPGCVCAYPGEVRGPNGDCIAPPLCPSDFVFPDDSETDQRPHRQYPQPRRQYPKDSSEARVDPDEADQYPVTPRVDLDEADQYPVKHHAYKPGREERHHTRQPHHYRERTVDPDEADQYPVTHQADSDEVEQYPETHPEKFHSKGCPSSSACSMRCKMAGYKWGMCTGRDKMDCRCYSHM